MERFTCWNAASVSETVFIDIGALSRSTDAVFLAAHTPARVRHLHGPEEHVGTGGGEAQVLAALLADVGTYPSNTLIAVTGSSGSGKSHIVRWVYAQLRQSRPDLHVLYVPRELSNLRDLLRTLIKGLGLPDEEGQEMLARVEDAIGSTTEPEIASRLRSAMAQALRWQFPPVAPASEETAEEREHRETREILLGTWQPDGRRRGGLADMIDIPLIWEHLEREGGTLRVIAGSIAGNAADRNRSLSRFVPDDLHPRGMGKDRDVREFLSAVKARPGPALALLQEALDKAFPEFVGLTSGSGETLDSLFRDARIKLKESGRDLVLLFEDLVQFGPIDGALYAQFRNQPTDELAPLRVVFAITSSNWEERGPETVKRRLRHQFEVLPIQDGLDGADASDAPVRDFLARYLNLVRVGRAEVEAAWSAADDESRKSGSWIPNACETREHGGRCQFADDCRPGSGFGSADVPPVGHVGLYPFNESALQRLARKMGADAGTPGRLLHVALEEVLVEARPHIRNGTYPDRRAEDHFDYHFVSTLPALKRGVAGEAGGRLLRANVIWGDDRQITSSAVLEAFALPPLADGPGPVPGEPRPQDEEPGNQSAETPEPQAEREPLPLLVQVNAWSQRPAEFLESSVESFREWLYRGVVARLRLDQDLIHVDKGIGKDLLESVLARYSFVFPGAEYGRTPGRDRLQFDITPDDETVALLIGVMWFNYAGHWQPEAGPWAWPTGFDPGPLQRVTNGYLQRWADKVRTEVVRRTLDPSIRDEVVALKAIARQCLGEAVPAPAPPGGATAPLGPVGSWALVESMARSLLSETEKSQWLSDLAAVRQSDDAEPQLVDTIGTGDVEKAAVASPWITLTAACGDKRAYAATLAVAATGLRDAIEVAAQEQVQTVEDAVREMEQTLGGADLADVAKAAREAGDRALNKYLFRPADGWGRFTRACDLLPTRSAAWDSRSPIVVDAGVDVEAETIRMQSWCRSVIVAGNELEIIRASIAATAREARSRLSGSPGTGDAGDDLETKATKAALAIKTIVGSAEGEAR
jgi:hypothetical protein